MQFLQFLSGLLIVSAISGCPSGEEPSATDAGTTTAVITDQPTDSPAVTGIENEPQPEVPAATEKKPAPADPVSKPAGNNSTQEIEPLQEPGRGQDRPRPTQPYVIIADPVPVKGKNVSMNIRGVRFSGNMIHITFSYGGGCKDHSFELFSTGKKENGVIRLQLVDHQTEDMCKALVSDTRSFDIKTLKDPSSNEISVKVNDYGPVTWSY